MNTFVFHPDALDELQEQALYYELRSEGLGERFIVQVEAAAALAASMPTIGSPYKHATRRVFPKDFPFSVVYRQMDVSVVIVAVAAFRRKPGYWRHRAWRARRHAGIPSLKARSLHPAYSVRAPETSTSLCMTGPLAS